MININTSISPQDLQPKVNALFECAGQKIEAIKELFGISELELAAKLEKKGFEKEALINLVIEHMALLAVEH